MFFFSCIYMCGCRSGRGRKLELIGEEVFLSRCENEIRGLKVYVRE